MRIAAFILAFALFTSAAPIAQTRASRQTQFEVEQALMALPTYGVFDFLAFGLDRGTVTLEGYTYSGSLKSAAVRAVKRLPGVDSVNDRIEQLPPSSGDDRIRWATFYRIYGDDFLSRYAPGGAMAARYELIQARRFPGLQPSGTYPIHIVVRNGRTTLMGIVDSPADKVMAEFRARDVSGVFSVRNELVVESD